MLLLTSTSDLIQAVTVGATENLQVHASYMDLNGTSVTPGRLNTNIAAAGTNTVVASPGSGVQRNVKGLSVYNGNASAATTVTIQHTDGSNVVTLLSLSLPAGYSVHLDDTTGGWTTIDNNGNALVLQPASGRLLKRSYLSAGSSFTTTASTNSIVAYMVGAGGQGGGAAAVTGEEGSGGGAGSYAEYVAAVQPNTAYSYSLGTGGSTGGTAANGQAGTNTTLTIGATTVTCPGGSGGLVGNSAAVPVLGGAGGTIPTNGSLNVPGQSGDPSKTVGTAADNASGGGGSSPYGSGGAALLNASNATGNAATGFGAGGGGATSTGTARAGGVGTGGLIIIDEYS